MNGPQHWVAALGLAGVLVWFGPTVLDGSPSEMDALQMVADDARQAPLDVLLNLRAEQLAALPGGLGR
ncbi:MAG: hypothetical protein V4505_15375 [Pseudomonadota bacterium]